MTEIVKRKWRERFNLVKQYYKNGKKILTQKEHVLYQKNAQKLLLKLNKYIY